MSLLIIASFSVSLACRFDASGPSGNGDSDDDAAIAADATDGIIDAADLVDSAFLASCSNGSLDGTESDVDCGGDCPPCEGCRVCTNGADCESGSCTAALCQPQLWPVPIIGGGTRDAYLRADGAILLAHYGAGARVNGYDQTLAQIADSAGGAAAPAGWAPDPCLASGHIPFTDFGTVGRTVTIECGADHRAPTLAVSSSTLFGDFTSGDKGTYGASGTPGWGTVAATGSGLGRGGHGSCGDFQTASSGGIAYCDGPGSSGSFDNHLVSYFTRDSGTAPFVGCESSGCAGATCEIQVWVWLHE